MAHPVSVCHQWSMTGTSKCFSAHFDRVGVGALPGKKQGLQARQIVVFDAQALRVGPLDRAESCRRGEQGAHAVFGNDPPKCRCVGRSDRLAFEHHTRVAGKQWRVANVGVAHDPSDVGGGPKDLSGIHSVNVLHRPLQSDQMAGGRPKDAFGLPGRPGGIEDVRGMRSFDRDAVGGFRAGNELAPVEIAPVRQTGFALFPLRDDAEFRLVVRNGDRLVQKGFVFHDPARLDPARRRQNAFGFGIGYAHCKLVGRKASEDDRVHGSQPRASQHGLKRFGNHRHVDDDAIPFRYPFRGHGPGQSRDAAEEFGERDRPFCSGDGAVVDDCGVFAPAGFDVPVQGVPAGN